MTTAIRKYLAVGALAMSAAGLSVAGAGAAGADPFPAQNENACENVDGTFYSVDHTNTCVATDTDTTEVRTAGQSDRAWYRIDETTVTYTRTTGGGPAVESTTTDTDTSCVNPGDHVTGSDQPCT